MYRDGTATYPDYERVSRLNFSPKLRLPNAWLAEGRQWGCEAKAPVHKAPTAMGTDVPGQVATVIGK